MKTLTDYGIRLRHNRNGEQKTLCPQCSAGRKNKKDPCLSVKIDSEGAIWNCHNCDFKGSTGRIHDRPVSYKRPSYTHNAAGLPEKVVQYFAGRGISASTLEANKVNFGPHYIPKDGGEVACIQFPFYRDGECVNVKYRSGTKGFSQSAGAEKVFYGMDDVPQDCDILVIVEGEMDKLACNEAGMWNVVSVPDGAPNAVSESENGKKFEFIDNCCDFLESFETIILATDNDKNGHALREEISRRVGKDKCMIVDFVDGCKDANDVLMQHGPDDLRGCISMAKPYPVNGLYRVMDFYGEIKDIFHNGLDHGVSTGFGSLDALYRIPKGALTTITGYPGSGKSEFLDSVCLNLAIKQGWKFVYCSLEKRPSNHSLKLVNKFLERPPVKQYITEAELTDSVSWLNDYFHLICPGQGDKNTIEWALERAAAAVKRYGVNGVVLDPYNRFYADKPDSVSETEWINRKLESILTFCRVYDVHLWFVAHPKKVQNTDYPAGLSDISGSAHWWNATDFGISVHRPYDKELARHTDITEIHIKKVRDDAYGQEGMIKLSYDTFSKKYTEAY
jgi:twinkle protein